MKRTLLVSVAAIALTAASTISFAQTGGKTGAGASGGASGGATMNSPSSGASGNVGGNASGNTGSSSTVNPTGDSQSNVNEHQAPGAHKGAQDTTTQHNQKSGQAQSQEKSRTQQSQGEQPRGERSKQQSQTEERGERSKQQSQTEQRGTSRQGAAERPMTSKNVSLTTEQKTTIRQTVLTANAPRVTSVNFDVRVGTVVPRSVHIVPLPTTIVDIQPDWRGYMYFVRGDEIVVVEPDTLRIVAVLDV